MPILAVPDEVVVPPSGPPEGGPRVHAWWTGGNGDEVHLTDCPNGIDWTDGRAGEDLPPFTVTADVMPEGDQPAETIRGVRAAPRTLTLPLLVHAESNAAFRVRQQRLIRAFNPLNGEGTLRYLQPDGTTRVIRALYESGAEGDSIRDRVGLWWRLWGVTLTARDPFWSSLAAERLSFGNGAGVGFFPLLPVTLASSAVLGETTATLAGDVRTWGVWTIHGPADGLVTLANVSLGREVKLQLSGAYELAEGETVVVDMHPSRARVTAYTAAEPDGVNWYGARVGVPQMWPLKPGANDIALSVTGATSATSLEFAYTPRWLAA
jgi:hypothetical protein